MSDELTRVDRATRSCRSRTRREEHWRFTDLRGFDPDALRHERTSIPVSDTETMLDLDVAGYAAVTEARHRRSRRRPTASRFEPLPEDDERLYSLVGWDDKFAAHNAAMWQHGLLVLVPKGVAAREAALRAASRVTGPDALLAAARRRRGGLALHRSSRSTRRPRRTPPPTRTRSSSSSSSRARSSSTSRCRTSRSETWHFATHHARVERDARARLGRRRLRLEEGQDADPERPERPGRDLARHRRVLRRRRPAPRLRHVPGAHRAELRVATSRSRARCATTRPPSGAG